MQVENSIQCTLTDYENGAELFARFVKRPNVYKDRTALLRVKMIGNFGGWRLRDALYEGFGFVPGEALFMNDIFVVGKDNIDVDMDIWCLNCFASGEQADWIDDNNITTNTVFEGIFKFAFETVKNSVSSGIGNPANDAKIAMLILETGLKVIDG